MSQPALLTGVRHPYWSSKIPEWEKWRMVYNGGQQYIDRYIVKFSEREDEPDFNRRKLITPTPNFAKAALNDIKNSIFQRLVDVARRGGSESYVEAVRGKTAGVDLRGSSMNAFIGRELLIELLVMSSVGVFIDMPQIDGPTLYDAIGKTPYIYKYCVEDILSWTERPGSPDEFSNILLRDYVEIYHELGGLPCGTKERYRYMFIGEDGFVHVQFYEQYTDTKAVDGKSTYKERQIDVDGFPTSDDLILEIKSIPFVRLELSDSILADVANHQIALLNMESSDLNYTLKSNFPFYTEQDDGRGYSPHLNGSAGPSADGTAASVNAPPTKEIKVGATHGRRYGKDMDRPGFINPSAEPLTASMAKQAALKEDIRSLVNLSLSTVNPKMASAESKQIDNQGLESGLSSIGLELEHAERRIAHFWHLLEGKKPTEPYSIKYPEKWSLKTDADRRADATSMRELRDTIPSATFQKSVSKEIAYLVLGDKVPNETLDKITEEIDSAKSYTADPETIFKAIEAGVLDLESAAVILGWPKEVVQKAADDHAARLERIAESQSQNNGGLQNPGARGITELDPSPGQSAKNEKTASRDTTTDANPGSKVRGDAQAKATL